MVLKIKVNYNFVPNSQLTHHNSLKKEELFYSKRKDNSEKTKNFKSYLDAELNNSNKL